MPASFDNAERYHIKVVGKDEKLEWMKKKAAGCFRLPLVFRL
jgi:hypothetical protein